MRGITWAMSFLHVCGGDPNLFNALTDKIEVFSTYVEVILQDFGITRIADRFLHVCGGDPEYIRVYREAQKFSPRMWR